MLQGLQCQPSCKLKRKWVFSLYILSLCVRILAIHIFFLVHDNFSIHIHNPIVCITEVRKLWEFSSRMVNELSVVNSCFYCSNNIRWVLLLGHLRIYVNNLYRFVSSRQYFCYKMPMILPHDSSNLCQIHWIISACSKKKSLYLMVRW